MPTALNDLLKATSRSFYLTLRVLPARAPADRPRQRRAAFTPLQRPLNHAPDFLE